MNAVRERVTQLNREQSVTQLELTPVSSHSGRGRKFFRLHKNTAIPEPESKERPRAYMSRVLYILMVKEGLRWKNEKIHRHNQEPTYDELSQHIEEWAWQGGHTKHTEVIRLGTSYEIAMGNEDRKGTLDFGVIERLARNAADAVDELWRREFYPDMLRKAQKGGMAHRTFTLDDHLRTAHLGDTDACRELGWDPKSGRRRAYRMKAHYQEILNLHTGEVLDETRL